MTGLEGRDAGPVPWVVVAVTVKVQPCHFRPRAWPSWEPEIRDLGRLRDGGLGAGDGGKIELRLLLRHRCGGKI